MLELALREVCKIMLENMKDKIIIVKENKTTVAVIAAAVGALVALVVYKVTHKKRMISAKEEKAVEDTSDTSVQ